MLRTTKASTTRSDWVAQRNWTAWELTTTNIALFAPTRDVVDSYTCCRGSVVAGKTRLEESTVAVQGMAPTRSLRLLRFFGASRVPQMQCSGGSQSGRIDRRQISYLKTVVSSRPFYSRELLHHLFLLHPCSSIVSDWVHGLLVLFLFRVCLRFLNDGVAVDAHSSRHRTIDVPGTSSIDDLHCSATRSLVAGLLRGSTASFR